MVGQLQGKVAIVTGASSGFGRAIAKEFATQGAMVVCADLGEDANNAGFREDDGLPTAAEIRKNGGEATFQHVDVSRINEVQSVVQAGVQRYGRLDIMVNNAGIFLKTGRMHEILESDYDLIMAVNTKGVWNGCQAAFSQFLKQGDGGRVINIASIGGLVGLVEEPDYCTSKGAVVNLTRQAAIDYARDGITVNAICPGFSLTAMSEPYAVDKGFRDMVMNGTPQGRFLPVEDVGKLAAFIASGDAAYITGAVIPIDGGWTAK